MRKFLASISVALDILKSFLIAALVVCAIVVALISILHNVFKIREIYAEDRTGYKNLVWVNENRMNVQVAGSGEKTIVILSDFATPSPIIQYKTYVKELSNTYRVVVIENFGYGFSLSTKTERTSSIIAQEIKTALEQSGITGSYTILANGISSIYAETYANTYPDEVERMIFVDAIYPETIKNNYLKGLVEDMQTNAVLTSYAELTGFARVLSYVKPDVFGIDKMEEYGFTKNDISLYRKMIANRFYTGTMKREIKQLDENMEAFKDYTLPTYLPVTQILSSEYVKEYEGYKTAKYIDKDLREYATSIITNPEIQEVVVIEGNKNLNIYNPQAVIAEIIDAPVEEPIMNEF